MYKIKSLLFALDSDIVTPSIHASKLGSVMDRRRGRRHSYAHKGGNTHASVDGLSEKSRAYHRRATKVEAVVHLCLHHHLLLLLLLLLLLQLSEHLVLRLALLLGVECKWLVVVFLHTIRSHEWKRGMRSHGRKPRGTETKGLLVVVVVICRWASARNIIEVKAW